MKVTDWNVLVRWGGVVLTLLCAPFVVAAQDYDLLSRGVVKLTASKEQGKETGAGIVIGREDGVVFVLTALHVVAKANKIEAEFLDKRNFLFEAKQIESQYDPLDLAVVRIDPRPGIATPIDFPLFTLGTVDELKLGAAMSSIGHAQEDWQLNPRMHALSKKESNNDVQRFRFSDPGVGKGSSGGPVFDEQGRLLGLVTDEAAGGGHAVAVKIDAAERQLKGWKVPLSFWSTVSRTAAPPVLASPSRPPAPSGMVPVLAGAFFMGCNEKVDTECEADEKPGRTVSLAAFQIDTTEVTVAGYRRCVEAGKCTKDGVTMPYWSGKEQPDWAWACNWGKTGKDDHPINCVDWSQAKTYCEWAGKRLPTEAEWEKAARGTDGRKYSWGNTAFAQAGKVANIADETAKKQQPTWGVAEGYDDGYYGTAPVGSFPAGESPFRALDMIGNVWEWTADWYDKEQTYRSVRGGSWNSRPRYARASNRNGDDPGSRTEDVGFRCAQ